MNERYTLNHELIRAHLEKEDRKHSYLAKRLCVSDALVDRMLTGHVPKERTLKRLAELLGIQVSDLLIPKRAA